MAIMNINIINPVIDLIKQLRESSNSCTSIFEFTIQSSPRARIVVDLVRMNNLEDYKYAQIDLGSGYKDYVSGTEVSLNSTGTAKFRVIVGNPYQLTVGGIKDNDGNTTVGGELEYACATTEITVSDLTNIRTESTSVSRCNDYPPCDELPIPVAEDDTYNVVLGSTTNLPIMDNDSSGSSYTTIKPVLDTQPLYGTVTVLDSGIVSYTHTGTTEGVDTFTYHVINSEGDVSNVATVTINISTGTKPITNDTKIMVFTDMSGTMNDVKPALEEMKNTTLRAKIEKYYNSPADYDANVEVGEFAWGDDGGSNENTLEALHYRIGNGEKLITFVFQDEADNTYYSNANWSPEDPRWSAYDIDITNLNSKLDNYTGEYHGIIMQVGEAPVFTEFLEALKNGYGNYSGKEGLSQRDNIVVEWKLTRHTDPTIGAEYYASKVEEVLVKLGFII